MRHAPRFTLLVMATALALALPAAAQDRRGTVELTPVVGGYFGGTFDRGTLAFLDHDADASTEVAWGLKLGFNVSDHFAIEASYLQSSPRIEVGGGAIGGHSDEIGEMDMRLYELNVLVPWGQGRVRPYFTIGGGVNTFSPDIPGYHASTDSRFTANLGLGVKAFVTPNFGFRFEGKVRSTFIDNEDDHWHCDDWWGCDGDYWGDSQWYSAGEATAGVIFAF